MNHRPGHSGKGLAIYEGRRHNEPQAVPSRVAWAKIDESVPENGM